MSSATTTTTVDTPAGVELIIKTKDTRGKIPFSTLGRINISETTKETPMDVINLLAECKPNALQLFKTIKDGMSYKTNMSALDKLNSKSQVTTRSKALRQLIDKDMIKRTGKQRQYMVNPNLIVPPAMYQKDVLDKWNTL